MIELTLQGAKDVIERTKACRPRCSECQSLTYAAVYTVQSGRFPHLPDAKLQGALGRAFDELLGEGWEHSPHSPSFTKRCEKCAATPEFPWANRLDAEKVLSFMLQQHERGAFWLGELEKTL